MRALDHRLPGQGRSQGGRAKRVCALPLGFSGTRVSMAREGQDSGGGNRNPHISHEICAETDKKACQGSRDPSDHLVPRENQGPSDYQALPTVRGPMNMRGPVSIKGPLIGRGPSEH